MAKKTKKLNARPNAIPTPALTRAQVATALNVSVSSVRRLEGDTLHPAVDDQGVRRFALDEVQALARQKKPLPKNTINAKADLSQGEIAALAFECFEQRQALAEIVIGLRLTPEAVRNLRVQWRRGFGPRGEVPAPEPDLPTRSKKECEDYFSRIPLGVETRISVARFVWDTFNETFGREYQEYTELCGFISFGPITLDDIRDRYGSRNKYRVSAYSLVERRMLWEILTGAGVF